MASNDTGIRAYQSALRKAAEAGQKKSQDQRSEEVAERTRVRANVIREIIAGELATQEDLQHQRYKG